MVREGYKQTEVGLIPEDWSAAKMGDICTLINGRGFKPYEWGKEGLPIIRIQNLNGSEEFNYYAGPYNKKIFIQDGQLLFAWSGSKGTSFGPHVWKGQDALLNYHTWKLLVDNSKIESNYFYHILKVLTVSIEEKAHGASALVHTQKGEMEQFCVPLPSNPKEQQAIAEALSDVDGLIDGLEKLIAKKRDIKTATMQQLLTGKTRLPGFGEGKGYKQTELGEIPEDWEVVYFKNCCSSFKTGKLDANAMKQDGEYHFYTCARYPFRIDTYAFDLEALIVSGNGANVGYVHYYSGKFNAYQRTYVLSGFSADVGFLKVYLERNLAYRIHVEVNTGSTPYITMDTLTDMQLALPSFRDEQVAIAEILVDMESEIDAIKSRLDKVKAIKQGMMQELLTGKTRLV